MHVKNCATIRRSISLWALSRFGVIASISSIKSKQGARRYYPLIKCVKKDKIIHTLASSNASRNVFSDSPDIPETMEGADMLIKGTPSSFPQILVAHP